MKEFVFGSDARYAALDAELCRGKCYKFAGRKLPESCTPDTATLWFGKSGDKYRLCIDKCIETTSDNAEFRSLLEQGEMTFCSIDGIADFMRSLRPMFEDRPVAEVMDRQKLQEIKEREQKPRKVWPEDIAASIKKRVFGQDSVIDALADKVAINQMRRDRRLLTVALMGPTATGKSETAKALAEAMSEACGVRYGYIEIAGSEFIGEHTVHRFFGAPPGYVGHGGDTILQPVRSNPRHVIVINEIEKADDKILVGLMEAIDTGVLGMADNSKPIDLNQCILLFTSNIPIDMEVYESASDFQRAELCRDAFTKHCGRPEISGKIGNFLVFSPLSDDAVADIIVKFVREELDSYNLKLRHIDEHLMADFLRYRTKYGARGIRGLVSESVGKHLLRCRTLHGSGGSVTMTGTPENTVFEIT